MKRIKPLFILVSLIALVSCKTPVQEMPQEKEEDQVKEQFVRVNRYLYQRQQDHIAAFVERAGMKASTRPSGLWLVQVEKGEGPRIQEDDLVRFSYESRLLSGEYCYAATAGNPKQLRAGKGDVESGVEEALFLLSEGDSALLFIPSHLAHGNFGDREKVPGNSILIYKLRILNVQ